MPIRSPTSGRVRAGGPQRPEVGRRQRKVAAARVLGLVSILVLSNARLPLGAQIARSDEPTQHAADAPVARAVRTAVPISVDGRLDEDVWMTAPAITDFRQTVPYEGEPITERTEIRFLYDDDNIYVGAWLWDRGQVLSRLARRDVGVPDADFFVVLFDSYHDHRTAYRFATSPAGMKRDEITSGGGNGSFGDTSWDPIWDIETSVTDEGWFVEMRIPFSQLRYSADPVQTWGLQVERKIRRHGEDTVWAFTPRSERGGVARYGHLVGIEEIAQGKRLELLPYLGGRAEYVQIARTDGAPFDNPFRSGSDYFSNAGLDLKYRLTSNITLDATVNPDFGQVELDPAVINLTAFETRFDERRPFFVEGDEIFDFGGSQLLYSRRIGRAPQGAVPGSAVYSDVPGATTILGAVKLTGKTPGGWSIGVLDATSGREKAPFVDQLGDRGEAVVEPLTNYFAGRVRREFGDGSAGIGIIGTAVHRALDDLGLDGRLRSSAYTAGIDASADIADRRWTVSAALATSHIRGDSLAIGLAQRSSARYFQRADAGHLDYDPAATSLSGMFGRLQVSKQAGDWRGGATLAATTPGYEINDLGFQSAADRASFSGDFGYDRTVPGRTLRSWSADVSSDASWNFAGDRQAFEIGVSGNGSLHSFHSFNLSFSRQFEAWDDRLTRGGPMTLAPAGFSAGLGLNSDSRRPVQIRTNFNFSEDDGGGWSRRASLNANVRFRGIYEVQIGPELQRSHNPAQFVTSIVDPFVERTGQRRYIFAPLDQTTLSLQTRFNATFTPDLSLELYAQPLLSSGNYHTYMELAAPGTFDFDTYGASIGTIEDVDGSYLIDPDGPGPASEFALSNRDFNVRSLVGSAVLRWEWRAGSTLYVVWQQTRFERLVGLGDTAARRAGRFYLGDDARALASLKPDNILQLKVNYWLNP